MNKRSKEYMDFRKLLINFRKKGYSGIIPFVYEGKQEIHQYMQYEDYNCLYGQDSKSKKSINMTAN